MPAHQNVVNTLQKPLRWPFLSIFNKSIKSLNFEFMDSDKVPSSLRSALRDILEVGNRAPFRKYYQWMAGNIHDYAKKHNITNIVELGAGCAPITKELIQNYPDWKIRLTVTDINPDVITFKNLEEKDSRVKPMYQPLDFSKKWVGHENALLVLSATFHHIPENLKNKVLSNLKTISPHVLIFEPLRPTISSFLFVIGGLFSGLLTPIFKANTKHFFRTFLWCWLVPIAPFMFVWDGWVSSVRCWSAENWNLQEPKALVEESLFCTKVILK